MSLLLPIKDEPELELECLQVKQESDEKFDYTVCESTAAAGLYTGHEVKPELVLGPTVLQPADIVFTRAGTLNNRKHHVKSAEDYEPNQAKDLHSGAILEDWLQLRACSVRLERLPPSVQKHANNRIPSTIQKQTNHKINPKGPQASALSEFSCSTCGEHFVQKQSLTRHTQLCSTQNNVVRHEQIEYKSYKCRFCMKHFSQKAAMVLHEKTHMGQSNNCEHCQKSFPTKQTLIQHVRIHTKPYKCEICLKQFSRLDHLNAHKYTHTGDKPYKCELCLTQFTQRMHLTIHKRVHTGEKPYKCELCKAEFLLLKQLRVHKYVHTSEKRYKCDICSKTFSYKHTLVVHIEGHMSMKPARERAGGVYPCPVCGAVYDHRDRLLRHAQRHIWPTERPTGHTAGQRSAKNPCKKSLRLKTNTIRLERIPFAQDTNTTILQTIIPSQTNSGIKPSLKDCSASDLYCCDACGKQFTWKRSLIQHIKLHNSVLHTQRKDDHDESQLGSNTMIPTKDPSTGLLPITESKSLPTKGMLTQVEDDSLVRYELGYTKDKPHKCRYCMKRFYFKSHFVRHERIHTGEKPYKCDICLRQFTVSSSLKTHKRIHTGEKPYKCDICLKEFAQSASLLTHKRIHSGDKPYKCDFCSKSFSQNTPLVLHRRTHTGEKPYKCDICLRRFSQSKFLSSHQRTHSKE